MASDVKVAEATLIGPAERKRLLRSSFLFSDLPDEMLDRLTSLSTTRRLDRGELLFSRGDDGDALYAVIAGLIRIWISSEGGKELILGLMEPGDAFGEIALLDGLPRTASATASEDSVLLQIRRDQFLDFLTRDSGLARHVIELLCERLRGNTTMLAEFAFSDLRARLARRLEALAVGHGRRTAAGTEVGLKLSQSDLANMLGVSREAINKQLAAWSQEGIIALRQGRIVILDATRLGQFRDNA